MDKWNKLTIEEKVIVIIFSPILLPLWLFYLILERFFMGAMLVVFLFESAIKKLTKDKFI